jgi:hypothetical protein
LSNSKDREGIKAEKPIGVRHRVELQPVWEVQAVQHFLYLKVEAD